jgi:hypothetical protein
MVEAGRAAFCRGSLACRIIPLPGESARCRRPFSRWKCRRSSRRKACSLPFLPVGAANGMHRVLTVLEFGGRDLSGAGHTSMLAVMASRTRNVQVFSKLWSQGKHRVSLHSGSSACLGSSRDASLTCPCPRCCRADHSKPWSSWWIWRIAQLWWMSLYVLRSALPLPPPAAISHAHPSLLPHFFAFPALRLADHHAAEAKPLELRLRGRRLAFVRESGQQPIRSVSREERWRAGLWTFIAGWG